MWFTQTIGYVHKEITSTFITVLKDEGIHPAAKLLHFLFTLSQSLFQCNTIQYHIQLIYNALFYRGNTMGNILGLTQYHGPAILWANTHPKKISGAPPRTPRQGEWVYSTPGLQSQLNNISGSGRLGSTTNTRGYGHGLETLKEL